MKEVLKVRSTTCDNKVVLRDRVAKIQGQLIKVREVEEIATNTRAINKIKLQ